MTSWAQEMSVDLYEKSKKSKTKQINKNIFLVVYLIILCFWVTEEEKACFKT